MGILDDVKTYVSDKVSNMPMPEAAIKDVDVKGFGFDGFTYLVKVTVSNPYSVSIPIGEIKYKLLSAEREIASGTIPDPGSIKGNADTLLEVSIKVPHSALMSVVRDVCPDWDLDYTLEMGLIADFPAIGNITIPMSYKGEMKLPTFSGIFGGKAEAPESSADKKEESSGKVERVEQKSNN